MPSRTIQGCGLGVVFQQPARVYPAPKWGELGSDPKLGGRKYKFLILVGHSEGGVIVRKAILRQAQLHTARRAALVGPRISADEILAAYVKLFAPAYWGALLSGCKGILLRTWGVGNLVQPLLEASAAYKTQRELSASDRHSKSYRGVSREVPQRTGIQGTKSIWR